MDVDRTDDGNFLFNVTATDLVTGATVTQRLTTTPGGQARSTAKIVDTLMVFTARGQQNGCAQVLMRVIRGNREVESSVAEYVPPAVLLAGRFVTLKFQDTSLRQALREFADAAKLNIAVQPNYECNVTIEFDNVAAAEALTLMLKPCGLRYRAGSGVVHVFR
jgi:hypothetical protein